MLAGGKKAAPQPIENELKKSPFIGLPIVIGDRQKFLAALIVPNFDRLKEWAAAGKRRRARAGDRRQCRRSARLFQGEIDAYNADKPHHEQIRAFALLPADLTIEDGSITPTLKVKRRILENRYHALDRGDVRRRPESRMSREVVVVDGLRTPYARAGTELKDVPAGELGRIVITELLARTDFDPAGLDQVIFGNIAQPPDAVNVARVAALKAGVPASVPAFTVNRLCGSGLESIVDAYYRIAAGDADAIVAGGVESMSNIPLLYSHESQEVFTGVFAARDLGGPARRGLEVPAEALQARDRPARWG